MKKSLLIIICSLFLTTGIARAEEFSLYGVTMGMTREEINAHWQKLENGKYIIDGSVLMNITPEFDHRNRLYKLSFTIPIPLLDEHPVPYVTTSFQDLIQDRWASDDLITNIRTGRGVAGIMLTSKPLQTEYEEHIHKQMLLQLGVLLKP